MSSRKRNRVRKGDVARVVLTETAPEEVPIVFSNDGFYKHCGSYLNKETPYPLKELFERIIDYHKEGDATVPITYKIKKDQNSLRRLALLHPAAQFRFILFYDKYKDVILYYCSRSPISIRFPQKVGTTFYIKNENKNINKYKTHSVDTAYTGLISKHPSSFFHYSNDRLYRFFETDAFFSLEKKFSSLWLLDVSKCFDSIYTHAISWALKDKDFVKRQKTAVTFGNEFDDLMMFAKHAETNGIAIGPEASRIFAEIIFQKIDLQIIRELREKSLEFGHDYVIKRYVDDFIIFSKSHADAQDIANTVSSNLLDYNLHLNDGKGEKLSRPFFTAKSKVVHEINLAIDKFIEKFTNASRPLVPLNIRHILKLKKSFLDDLKTIASLNRCDYSLFSNYVISSLCKRAVSLIENGSEGIAGEAANPSDYKQAITLLLEVSFFLYTVNPTVWASYRLCKAIILSTRFVEKELPDHQASLKQRILEMFLNFYESCTPIPKRKRADTVCLELINLLLAMREMGTDYLVPEDLLQEVFEIDSTSTYFELMSCLFYVKDSPEYKTTFRKLEDAISQKLSDLKGTPIDAEKAYILLDTFTCPYFSDQFKVALLIKLNAALNATIPMDDGTLGYLKKQIWFINWVEIDLLNILEKRELNAVY